MEIHNEVYIHAILVVDKYSWGFSSEQSDEIFHYVKKSFGSLASKVLAINGQTDHVHILFKMNLEISLDELLIRVRLSSAWSINNNLMPQERFAWENTYYAFTIGRNEIEEQIEYLERQQDLHLSLTMNEELKNLIDEFDLQYDGDDLTDMNEDNFN